MVLGFESDGNGNSNGKYQENKYISLFLVFLTTDSVCKIMHGRVSNI